MTEIELTHSIISVVTQNYSVYQNMHFREIMR